jgi:uncharacterized protein (DUF1778 family)
MAKYNHKGGRTMRLDARLSPEEKATLQAAAKAAGKSLSDFIMMLTAQYLEKQGKHE